MRQADGDNGAAAAATPPASSAPSATSASTAAAAAAAPQQNWMLLAVISVAVLFVLVLAMVTVLLLRRRRKLKETEALEDEVAFNATKATQFIHGSISTLSHGPGGAGDPFNSAFGSSAFGSSELVYLPNDIRADEEMQPFRLQQREVVRGRLLAKGGYGAVFLARFRNETHGGGSNQHTNTRIAVLVSSGSLKPSISLECPVSVRRLINQCLEVDPASRPSAVQLHFELRNLDLEEEERREMALAAQSVPRRTGSGAGSASSYSARSPARSTKCSNRVS
ncbi:hypothetical protein PybrP1_001755 [[Pythium] brassicae (nom. inval.)]|nr:hypothetical protein PybrP1_001755 [[Pythium] brassicae (nom. inval.)]